MTRLIDDAWRRGVQAAIAYACDQSIEWEAGGNTFKADLWGSIAQKLQEEVLERRKVSDRRVKAWPWQPGENIRRVGPKDRRAP